jgi:hypothetical protein
MPETADAALITKLLRATRNGKITWEKTTTQDQFAASYAGKWTVAVDKSEDRDTGAEFYYLTITNAEGEEVLRIYNVSAKQLPQLFEQARRRSLKVDEAVSDLLKEIGEDGGEPEITDEDIPF